MSVTINTYVYEDSVNSCWNENGTLPLLKGMGNAMRVLSDKSVHDVQIMSFVK